MRYITKDGHLMKPGEIMWRVCNTDGKWDGKEPGRVVFDLRTGYNGKIQPFNSNGVGKMIFDLRKPSFPATQIHFFNKEKAIKYLNKIQ